MTSPTSSAQVPLTPIMELYRQAKKGGATGLHEELTRDFDGFVARIAEAFGASVAQIGADYKPTPNEPFRPKYKPFDEPATTDDAELDADPLAIRIARDVAISIATQREQQLVVDGHDELVTTYVDYEVSVLRTLGNARFTDDTPAGRALVADVLMRSRDNVPVLTEVKLRNDATPVLGAIQVLTYAAHVASPAQYARLSVAPPGSPDREPFAPYSEAPRLDAFVLLVQPPASDAGKVSALHRDAPRFIAALHARPEIRAVVRRFELLGLAFERGDSVIGADGAITAQRLTIGA